MPDDVVFERVTPNSPKQFDDLQRNPLISHQIKHKRGSADKSSYHASEMTPDSPISQVNYLLFDNLLFSSHLL